MTEKKKEDELQNIRKTSQFAWTGISKKNILSKKICLSMICATPFSHSGYPLGDMRSGPDDTHRRKSLGYFSEGVANSARFRNQRPTDRPTDRPTEWLIESRARD